MNLRSFHPRPPAGWTRRDIDHLTQAQLLCPYPAISAPYLVRWATLRLLYTLETPATAAELPCTAAACYCPHCVDLDAAREATKQ